jgi:hypothetical protein
MTWFICCKDSGTVLITVCKRLSYLVLFAVAFFCQACDSTSGPDNDNKCIIVSDTLDQINVDSAVLLSEPFVLGDYIVFNMVEYRLQAYSHLIVYSKSGGGVVGRLRSGLYDADKYRILHATSYGIEAYYFSTGTTHKLLSGYYWPTNAQDSCIIHVRTVNSTHKYDICTSKIVDVAETNNVRQVDNNQYVLYEDGYWLYNDITEKKKLITEDFNGWAYAPRLTDWDVCVATKKIVVHFIGVEQDSDYDGLFEIDIETGAWVKLLGHTDGSYTPRYETADVVLVIRSCSVEGESYILRYNKSRKCEELVFTAKMRSDGVVVYEHQ